MEYTGEPGPGTTDRPRGGQDRTTTDTIDIAGLEGGPVSLATKQLDDLASRAKGRVLRPGDQGWDEAVVTWNGMAAKTPALVLQPTSVHDVAAAVRFARDHGLLLSIKGGGHNIAGTAIAEGGLTLDLSRMRQVTVDPDARLAHVGPGVCSATSTRPPRPTGWRPCSGSCPRPAWPG